MDEEKCTPWSWRKAAGGFLSTGDRPGARLFHAYDVNDNGACDPWSGLAVSCEPPDEGSAFCPECMGIVRAEPYGRERRVYT